MSWDPTIQEWLIDTGGCCAGALSGLDGYMYAAAPVEDDKGWSLMNAEPHEQSIAQEDGTDKTETVDEAEILKVVGEGKRPSNGLWIAKEKYTVTRQETEDIDGKEVKVLIAGRPKKGVVVYTTEKSIIVGMFDVTQQQDGGNCRKAVMAFATFLLDQGL